MNDLISKLQMLFDAAWNENMRGRGTDITRMVTTFIPDAIQAIGAEQKWIPVTERLPSHGSQVLCITQYCFKYEVMQWDSTAECWYAKDGCHGRRYVTHWMPLPQPPKEDA